MLIEYSFTKPGSGHLATERPLKKIMKIFNSREDGWIYLASCLVAIIWFLIEGRTGLWYLWVPFIGLMIWGAIMTLLQRW